MRHITIFLTALVFTAGLWGTVQYTSGMRVELGKEYVVHQGNTYDVFFYNDKGEPQFLKQVYSRISLPADFSLPELRDLDAPADVGARLLSDVIIREVKVYDRLRTFEIKPDFANRAGWMQIRDMFAARDVPVWPVVTYYDVHPLVLNGEIMIQFRKDVPVDTREKFIDDFNVEVVENSTSQPEYFLVKTGTGTDPFKKANNMYRTGLLKYAQPNWLQVYVNHAIPNDPIYSSQWHLPQINSPAAWDIETGSTDIIVGVVDSGVDTSHPDLDCVNGYDFADNDSDPNPSNWDQAAYHGTACAGISAALGNNGTGVTGVCQNCRIMPIRLITGQATYPSTVKNAIEWTVDNGAAVINNSWGPANENCQVIYENTSVTAAADYARENGRGGKGTLLVFAAGNDGCDASLDRTMQDDDLVVVSALGQGGSMESYSNWGSAIDVSAGAATHTTDIVGSGGENGSDYTTYFSGTSAAAPVVTGAIALMLSANEDMDFYGAMQCLKSGIFQSDAYCSKGGWSTQSDPYVPGGSAQHSPCFGFGVVDVSRMVNGAVSGDCASCIPTADIDLCFGAGSGRDDDCNDIVDDECDIGGIGKAGDACSEDGECLNTAADPTCKTESGWNGGYCSAECEKDSDCYNGVGGTNVTCYEGSCIARCDWNIVRDGYECAADMIFPEGTGPESVCGNEIKETGETCDGGYKPCTSLGGGFTDGYANCNEQCTGYDTSTCEGGNGEPVCGDGTVEGDEVCDGGTRACSELNDVPDDGNAVCNGDCSGWNTSTCTDAPDPVCGNGEKEAGEECDDGNNNPGDGCDPQCNIEPDPDAVCGNGEKEAGEECDDGNLNPGDGCDPQCNIEGTASSTCGDGTVDASEQCDDGNLNPGDGCDPTCRKEAAAGNEVCGNGVLEFGEQCDDGNLNPGDGCDPVCSIEGGNTGNGIEKTDSGCSCSGIVI